MIIYISLCFRRENIVICWFLFAQMIALAEDYCRFSSNLALFFPRNKWNQCSLAIRKHEPHDVIYCLNVKLLVCFKSIFEHLAKCGSDLNLDLHIMCVHVDGFEWSVSDCKEVNNRSVIFVLFLCCFHNKEQITS